VQQLTCKLQKVYNWLQANLYPGMTVRNFGEIEGIAVGTEFDSRAALAASGIHKPTQAGISGSSTAGADSVVVSGGYEDDEDYGDYIIYGGQVSHDPNTKRQIADAELARGNLALVVSYNRGLPVRVTRGLGSRKHTYRYDGLYQVERWWADRGKSGYKIYCFALRKIDDQPISTPAGELPLPSSNLEPNLVKAYTTRTVRATEASELVKKYHDHICQTCSTRLDRLGGAYAETAYLRPIGRPHNGPDTPDNIVCLCPNCHVLFDSWAFTIEDDGTLAGVLEGTVNEARGHALNKDHVAYHRRLFLQAQG
jgi:putative restriction endonuclease